MKSSDPLDALKALLTTWREKAGRNDTTASKAVFSDLKYGATCWAECRRECAHELEAALLALGERQETAEPPQPARNEWRLDERGWLDDVVVDDVATFRLERMGDDHVWGAVYHRDGTRTDFNLHSDDRLSLDFEHESSSIPALAAHREGPATADKPQMVDATRVLSMIQLLLGKGALDADGAEEFASWLKSAHREGRPPAAEKVKEEDLSR